MIAKLYIHLIKEYSANILPELADIEKRFPSVSKFDIQAYI